ncbi:hypothetical protein [Shinella zoogloeoides]
MHRKMPAILLVSAISLVFSAVSSAQVLGGVAGTAAKDVEVTCGSCCSVRNIGSRLVEARLALALGASATLRVGPGQSSTWMSGGSCFSGGFGVFANYVD